MAVFDRRHLVDFLDETLHLDPVKRLALAMIVSALPESLLQELVEFVSDMMQAAQPGDQERISELLATRDGRRQMIEVILGHVRIPAG
jgi:hypothetical protein